MSQSTEKILGQVLYDADHDPRIYLPYDELPAARRADYERMAQAVAAAAREQVAAWLEPQRNDVPATGAEFAAAIRWWEKKGGKWPAKSGA